MELLKKRKRFFCLPKDSYSLDDKGFLSESLSYNLKTIDDLRHEKFLVILGESGIGKTTCLEHLSNELKNQLNLLSFYEDLNAKDGNSFNNLFSRILEEQNNNKEKDIYLHLDALDECDLAPATAIEIIKDNVLNLNMDKLFFRISCRTSSWPFYKEESLRKLSNLQALSVYEICPLTQNDIIEKCKEENINAEQFLQEVSKKNLSSLASRPFTLKFLLDTYRKNGSIPGEQYELYSQGMEILCGEEDGRKFSHRTGLITVEDKLKIASDIALLTIFSKKNSIWEGDRSEYKNDLCFEDIKGFNHTENHIKQAIKNSAPRDRVLE